MQPRVEVGDECGDAGRLTAKLVFAAGLDVCCRQLDDEETDAGPILADARNDADQAAMHGVRDPQLVGSAFGEQPVAAVAVLFDVGLNLFCVYARADLGETERHRPTFRHQRQKRAPLRGVTIGEQRPGADRELTRNFHRERSKAVRGQCFLDRG